MDAGSITFGILGVVGVYNTCLQVLEQLSNARSYSHDAQNVVVSLQLRHLIFQQWGESLGIIDGTLRDPHDKRLDDPRKRQLVFYGLAALESLCVDSQKLRDSYGLVSSPLPDPGITATADARTHYERISAGLRSRSNWARIRWAIKDKKKSDELVQTIGALIQGLLELLPIEQHPTHGLQSLKASLQLLRNESANSSRQWSQRLQNIEHEQRVITQTLADSEIRLVLSWLEAFSPEKELDRCIRGRVPNTCEWLFREVEFVRWIQPPASEVNSPAAQVLWLNGKPGCGKTYLSAAVVSHIRPRTSQPLAFFFCEHDDPKKNEPLGILRSWIRQLAQQRLDAFQKLKAARVGRENNPATESVLWNLFQDIVRNLPQCYLVVDGLDECLKSDSRDLYDSDDLRIDFIEHLLNILSSTSAKLLVASRNEFDIRESLKPIQPRLVEIHVRTEKVKDDIEAFARQIVGKRLRDTYADAQLSISQQLTEKSDGMFLWIRLEEPRLRASDDLEDIQARIRETMPGLEALKDTYIRNLNRIDDLGDQRERESIRMLFLWVLYAIRPLSVREYADTLGITQSPQRLDERRKCPKLSENFVRERILEPSAYLIECRMASTDETAIANATLHVIHFSAKEILTNELRTLANELRTPLLTSLQLSHVLSGHQILRDLCLAYINANEFRYSVVDFAKLDSIVTLYPLYDYCTFAWPIHARTCSMISGQDSSAVRYFLKSTSNKAFTLWQKGYHERKVPPRSRITGRLSQGNCAIHEFLCLFGLNSDMNKLLEEGYSLEAKGCFYGTPLHAAVHGGHSDTVNFLLEKGASVRGNPSAETDPLGSAVDSQNLSIMRVLLENSANPNHDSVLTKDGFSRNIFALGRAAANRFYDGAGLLLRFGADPNLKHEHFGTALMQAAIGGDVEMLKLLIEHQARANEAGGPFRTALNAVCFLGHVESAKYLIDAGADLNTMPQHMSGFGIMAQVQVRYGGPLHCACTMGHDRISDYLLEKGAHLNADADEVGTPLEAAIYGGHETVALKLLTQGARILDRAPLEAQQPRIHTVASLTNGEGPNSLRGPIETMSQMSRTSAYRIGSVLHAAARSGSCLLVAALLDSGFDINLAREPHGTPLMAAVEGDHVQVVRMLIERKAELRYQCVAGTALQRACIRGRLEIIQILLDQGLEADSIDELTEFGSPLQAAAVGNQVDAIALLRSHGARVNAYYDRQPDLRVGIDSPFCTAALCGHIDSIAYLLTCDTPPTAEDMDRAAIEIITEDNVKNVGTTVRLLVDNGWESKSAAGGQVLLHLVMEDNFTDASFLLERGAPIVTSPSGNDVLHIAAQNGNVELVRFLLRHHPQGVHKGGSWGQEPLAKAAENGHLEVVNLLHEHGADIDSFADLSLKSSAWAAARNGHFDVVLYLYLKGASDIQLVENGSFVYLLEKESIVEERMGAMALSQFDGIRDLLGIAHFRLPQPKHTILTATEEPELKLVAQKIARSGVKRPKLSALYFPEDVELNVSAVLLGEILDDFRGDKGVGKMMLMLEEMERPPDPDDDDTD